MAYWCMVFSQYPLKPFSAEALISGVTASNFHTLCNQYGLNPALISPALACLSVEMSASGQQPLCLLRYLPGHQPPIVVNGYDSRNNQGKRLIDTARKEANLPLVRDHLEKTRVIYCVELTEAQLVDMGLLLAYELARCIAAQRQGIVLGLDRNWYRLNPYQAFIPIST